jgi:hypothetical protein
MVKFIKRYEFNNPWITSASGLILHQDNFYVVADDELGLIKLHKDFNRPAEVIQLVEGKLPDDQKLRKKLKPDFESLTYLPQLDSILCLGSGSKPQRQIALLRNSSGQIRNLNLTKIYEYLNNTFSELNLEGCTINEDQLILLQRGNGPSLQNAVIRIQLQHFLSDNHQGIQILPIQLGQLNNIPLSFTDATIYQKRLFFLAVAENSNSTYEDGEYSGAVIGEIQSDGMIASMRQIDIPHKPEGLYMHQNKIFIVTDADDRKICSRLYEANLDILT